MIATSKQSLEQNTIKHDINQLLAMFNQMDADGSGFITRSELNRLFTKLQIDVNEYCKLYSYQQCDFFEFDAFLSLLGLIEFPGQPSIYVLSFVRVLAQYRNKCIDIDSEDADQTLNNAKQVDEKIKKIVKKELQRQKNRLLEEHNKIYDEMNRTQTNQYENFESEWKKYLEEFKSQTHDKVYKTKNNKLRELVLESEKMVKTARRHSMVTSSRLRELVQKKKWLVKQGKYAQAIKINYLIEEEKHKISEHNEESLDYSLRKKMQSLKKKNQTALDYIQSSMTTNMNKLLLKKKEGENIMKLRMRNLRDEAQRKLNQHLRSELSCLRSAFGRAAKY